MWIVLLSLILGFSGTSSLNAQDIELPIVQVFSTDSIRPSAPQPITEQEDSALITPQQNSEHSTVLIDTLGLSLISDSLINEVKVPRKQFVPNSQRALWLSLIIPGAGQIYNRKYWKLPIVYGGFMGCVYALTWNNQMYRDYSQAYLDIMDDNPHTKSYEKMLPLNYDIKGKEEQFKYIFKNKKDYFRKYRDMSIFAFVGVYLLSVIDAYVDAELSSFDISRDLTVKVEPTLFNGNRTRLQHKDSGMGVQCQFNF